MENAITNNYSIAWASDVSEPYFSHKNGLAIVPEKEMEAMSKELDDLQKGVIRHIQLFAGTAAITQFLPALIAKYSKINPEIQVDLEEHVSEHVVLALNERRADIGVFVEGTDADGLEMLFFRSDELVLITPQGHKLSGKSPMAFTDTLDEQWISLNPGAAVLQQQLSAATSVGKRLKLRMQVNSFEAVSHMVSSGLGIALLPKTSALPLLRSMKLGWRPLKDDWAKRRLMIGVRKDANQDVIALRDYLVST